MSAVQHRVIDGVQVARWRLVKLEAQQSLSSVWHAINVLKNQPAGEAVFIECEKDTHGKTRIARTQSRAHTYAHRMGISIKTKAYGTGFYATKRYDQTPVSALRLSGPQRKR